MKSLLFANQLHGFKVFCDDGAVGHVDEFYFDDRSWKVRYCVIDIGTWLTGGKVLISPATIGGIDWNDKGLIVNATKERIQESRQASAEPFIARALGNRIYQYYGWEYSWPEPFVTEAPSAEGLNKESDPHLRSTKELTGASVMNETGGDYGDARDFLIDPASWAIAFMEVNQTKNGRFLLSTELVTRIGASPLWEIRATSPEEIKLGRSSPFLDAIPRITVGKWRNSHFLCMDFLSRQTA